VCLRAVFWVVPKDAVKSEIFFDIAQHLALSLQEPRILHITKKSNVFCPAVLYLFSKTI
jgi:hypothetical protein